MSDTKDRNSNCSSQIQQSESNGFETSEDALPLKNGKGQSQGQDNTNSVQVTLTNGTSLQQNGNVGNETPPSLQSSTNHTPNGNSAQIGANITDTGQPNNSASTNQHVVHVHVNPGETFSVRLGDQIQHIQGPATVRMVSNNGPPLPMPMQVPPGHMVQQIVDEHGILTHVILSPQPAVPGNPISGGPNSASQYYQAPYGPSYSPHQQFSSHHHAHPGQTVPPHLHSGVTQVQTPAGHTCSTHAPVHSPGPSPPMNAPDDRAARQRIRVKKKLERRRINEANTPRIGPSRPRRVNGDVHHPTMTCGGISPTENGPIDSEDDNTFMLQYLSNMPLPKVCDIETRSALIQVAAPEEDAEIDFDTTDIKYELLLSDKGREAKYKPVYSGDATEITLKDLKPATDYFLRVCTVLNDDLRGSLTEPITFRTASCEPDSPQPPKLVSRTKTSIMLKWNAAIENGSKISTYTLEYEQGDSFVEIYNGLQKQYRVSRLHPATRYTFRLAAINGIGKSEFSEPVSFYTSGTVPSQPDPPMLGSQFVYALTLSWIKRPNDDQFQLQMEDESSGHGFLSVYNGSSLSFTIRNLRRNTEYKYRLAAKNDEGQSKWSDVVCYRTLPEQPSVPAKPQVKGRLQSHSFRVTWDPPADEGGGRITRYILQLQLDDGNGNGYETVYEGLEREHLFEHLTPGHTYRVRVACYSSGGQSEFSEAAVVTTLPVVPGQCPSPKLQGKPKATSLHLRWSYPDDNGGAPVNCFAVQMISPDNTMREVYKGQDLDCIVAGLSPGRPYLIQVRAFNKIGAGPWSDSLEVISGAGVPDAPKSPSIVCKSPHSAIISWEEPFNNGAAITEYRLEWQHRTDQSDFFQLYAGPKTCYEAKGLIPASLYTLRVQAVNSAGAGQFSTHATCVTPPSSPSSVSTIKTTTTATSITMTWREPANNGAEIMGYNIDIGDKIINVDRVTEHVIDDLQPETVYRIKIQAVNEIGVGAFSSVAKVVTRSLPPSPPKLQCSMVGSNFLKLKWGDGRNPDSLSYTLEMEKPDNSFSTVYMGPAQTCKVNRLAELTPYNFHICASSVDGHGPYSEIYTFSTSKALPPVLKVPKVTSICLTGCVIEWQGCRSMGTDTIVYQLQMQCVNVPDSFYKQIYCGPNTFYTLDNLEPKTEYSVRVCAIRQGLTDEDNIAGVFSPGYTFCTQSPEPVKCVSNRTSETKVPVTKPLSDQQKAMIIVVFFVIISILIAFIIQKVIT
ncbi:hypothetical protein SNE40_001134 [Patella caerulea]|uniref:Fibronectin type-III domain-containing protein n=1 Tax=Patella caerulea TaxID=87958 RepID=A0AAN8Q360_PATCE